MEGKDKVFTRGLLIILGGLGIGAFIYGVIAVAALIQGYTPP